MSSDTLSNILPGEITGIFESTLSDGQEFSDKKLSPKRSFCEFKDYQIDDDYETDCGPDKKYRANTDDLYTVRTKLDGTKIWYKNDKIHRDNDEPAIITSEGKTIWYIDGDIHRDNDLPAMVYSNGKKFGINII